MAYRIQDDVSSTAAESPQWAEL